MSCSVMLNQTELRFSRLSRLASHQREGLPNALLLQICQRRHTHIHVCLDHIDASCESQGPTTHIGSVLLFGTCRSIQRRALFGSHTAKMVVFEGNVPEDRKFSQALQNARALCCLHERQQRSSVSLCGKKRVTHEKGVHVGQGARIREWAANGTSVASFLKKKKTV